MSWALMTAATSALAFWMGYSVNQGGTCAVATAYELLHHRRWRLFVGLVAASASAGLVAVPLVWSGLEGAAVAASLEISGTLVVGAILFGVGATVNDACLLGSLGRLGDGETRLLALPLGLAGGFLAVDAANLGIRHEFTISLLAVPSVIGVGVLFAFMAVLIASLVFVHRRQTQHHSPTRWPLGRAMVILGVTGGALYATAPAWTYADLVHRSLPLATAVTGDRAGLTVAATIVGAVVAAHRRRSWRLRKATMPDLGRTLIGGTLMGMGAAIIPGGNDGLVLAAMPALSTGGTVAYLTMTLTIILVLAARSRLFQRPSGS